MVNRCGAVAVVLAAACLVIPTSLSAQKVDKKLAEAQKKESPLVMKVADDFMAGKPVNNDFDVAWVGQDFLKAVQNKEYVPFTFTVDPSKVNGKDLVFYWRVIAKNPPPPDAKKDRDREDKSPFEYSDLSFAQISGSGPYRVSRAFYAGAGDYDLYLIVKEPADKKSQKISAIKQTVSVPNFWKDEIQLSTVILAAKVEPLAKPATPEERADRPYALGNMEIIPATAPSFKKSGELSPLFFIYNPALDSANKPDVTIEYNFYVKPKDGPEKFFNKTAPQAMNAQTVPPDWDATQRQLPGGFSIPLQSFPEGDYRLEIKVTDKISSKSLTSNVAFSVTAS